MNIIAPFFYIDTSLLLLIHFLLIITVLFYWGRIEKYFKLGKYYAVQKIHKGNVPRDGGIIFLIILVLNFYEFFIGNEKAFLGIIFLLFFTIVKEDLFHNVGIGLRFFSIFFVSFLLVHSINSSIGFPSLDKIPILSLLSSNTFLLYFFYTLGLATLANGMNMLDGVNGLCSGVFLSQLLAILFLSFIL